VILLHYPLCKLQQRWEVILKKVSLVTHESEKLNLEDYLVLISTIKDYWFSYHCRLQYWHLINKNLPHQM